MKYMLSCLFLAFLVGCASAITYSFKDGNNNYEIDKHLAYTKEDAKEVANSVILFNHQKESNPICSINKNINNDRYILDSDNQINLYQSIDLRNFDMPTTISSVFLQNNDRKDKLVEINFVSQTAFYKQAGTRRIREVSFNIKDCVSFNNLSKFIDQNDLDYKTFMESDYSIDLWDYYVIANNLINVVNKHNISYMGTEKLTPYELVEMHPYRTRNLTKAQKEEIKAQLEEFTSQLPQVYYSYEKGSTQQKIIFNEVIKKYNTAYNKLK